MLGDSITVEKSQFRVRVTSENESISFSSNDDSERMILPEALNLKSDLDYYMWGTSLSSDSGIAVQQITITPEDDSTPTYGYFEYPFERQFYRLSLVAVPHGTPYGNGSEVLKSSISVDLRACDDIKFILSNKTISSTGNAKIGFYADGWTIPTGYSAKAGIYSKIDDSPVFETMLGTFPSYSSAPDTPTYQIEKNEIISGTYLLKLVLSKNINGEIKSFIYSDDLVIAPKQTTTAFIGVPNIVVTIPTAPTYLISGYSDNTDASSDFYDVEFCWDDKSYNEEDFELEIIDVSDAINSTYETYILPLINAFTDGVTNKSQEIMNSNWESTKHVLSSNSYTKYTRKYFDNTNVKTDGSFTSNSVYAVIKLLYGKRYIARISAVNSAGHSDYAYLDLYNTGNRNFSQTHDINFTPQNWPADSSSMNRYRIEYYFTNGQFYDDTTNSAVSNYFSASEIRTQLRSTNYTILNPIKCNYTGTDTATLKYFYNGTYYKWEKWKNNSTSGSDYYLHYYDGFENLFLYAFYGDDVKVSDLELVIKSESNDYITSDIVVYAHKDGTTSILPFQQGTDISSTINNGTMEVSKSDYKYLSFLINKTNNHYSSSVFKIVPQGGQGRYIEPVSITAWYGTSYNYGQIDITEKDSLGNEIYKTGETYNLFITSILNSSTISFQMYIKIKE